MRLEWADIAVLVVYLAGITAVGVYFRRGQQSLQDYFLGGRTTPWWALSLSIVATETSILTVISTPALAFSGNLGFLQVVMGYMVARVIICVLFIPQYFRGQFLTAYELIERRFGKRMRRVAAGTFLLTRSLADGVRIAAIALVVDVAFGTGGLLSVVIVMALVLLYTFEGGLRAVIWTDVVQLVIYLAGAVVAFAVLLGKIPGGWAEVTQVAAVQDKFRVFDFAWDLARSYTFWAGLFGGTFLTLASHGTDQLMVQRLLAARNARDARLALLGSGVLVFAQFALFLVIGVMLYTYHQHAPLVAAGEKLDRVFPVFVVREMHGGLAGLLIAAMLAAAMSTASSTLNALASSSIVDFGRASVQTDDPGQLVRRARKMTLVWGAVLLALGMVKWGPLLEAGLTIASFTYGSLLGLFLLGMLNRRANASGALAGMVAGLAVTLAVKFFTPVAWTWYVLTGTVVTFVVGSGVSAMTSKRSKAGRQGGKV